MGWLDADQLGLCAYFVTEGIIASQGPLWKGTAGCRTGTNVKERPWFALVGLAGYRRLGARCVP